MSNAKAQTAEAQRLRLAGQLDAAEKVAREAVELDPKDPNAWWQLALISQAQQDESEERTALEQVTLLAPQFADGWCNLGYLDAGDKNYESALEHFRTALAQDPEHVHSLRGLAVCLKVTAVEDGKPEYIQALQKLFDSGRANNSEIFDLAYQYGLQGDNLASAHVYERLPTLSKNPVALQNLGIMYQRMLRGADAIDAFRLAYRLEPESKQLEKLLGTANEHRRLLREDLRQRTKPLLGQEGWYRHYVNPFELLDLSPENAQGSVKALQKAKQAVLRELELEDNTVAWLPGLHIDRSSVLSLLEELNDPALFEAHQFVFQRPELLAFLTKGELKYFTGDTPDVADIELQALHARAELEPLSLKFAAQFDDVLTLAIEQTDLRAVEALIAGRRRVLPEHAERCLEGSMRALLRMLEPLDKFSEQADTAGVKPEAVFEWLKAAPVAKLLPKLPVDFFRVHERFYRGMRGLSVAYFNQTQDADKALELLERSRMCVEMSPGLRHLFDEDKSALNERIAEQSRFDVNLTLGDKKFTITRHAVSYAGRTIAVKDVQKMRWGLTQTSVRPSAWRLSVAFGDGRGSEVDLTWVAGEKIFEEQRKLWGEVIQAALHYCMEPAMGHFKKKLGIGNGIPMGALLVFEQGVQFEIKGLIFSRKHFAPWRALRSSMQNGAIVVQDPSERKAVAALPLATTDNAFLVHMLCANKES